MITPKQEAEQKSILTSAHKDFNKILNSYAFFKVNNHETGEDLVQDTFIKTWSYLLKGGKIEAMKSFLYHILNNLIVDEYRKRKNKSGSLDVMIENGFEPSTDDSLRMTQILDGSRAVLLIKKLPKIYQNVMDMRFMKDLSLKEMSAITKRSQNAVAVQIHRGLGKLRLLYDHA